MPPDDSTRPDDRDLREAAEAGLRKAGIHFVKAGYEVLAGFAAFLSEINAARHPDAATGESKGPVRIPVEDDE